MISVVIPLYNKEKSIANTLRTVLQQTYQDFEIVVVNDGSTDNSLAEAESVVDSRIRIVSQPNSGVSAARNKGIEEAKYDLIAFLDADDEWKSEYLETQYNLYEKYPECSIFACNYEFRDHTGKVTPTIIRKLPFDGQDGILTNYFEVASCSHPPICSITIMVKKEAIKAIGGFPVGIKSGEDLLTWAKLASNYNISYSRQILSIYNLGEGYNLDKLPPRKQDLGDPVGKALKEIYRHRKIKGLRRYISLWHKMRASVALRFGFKSETLKESAKSILYYPCNFKIYIFVILIFLPPQIRKYLISRYQ